MPPERPCLGLRTFTHAMGRMLTPRIGADAGRQPRVSVLILAAVNAKRFYELDLLRFVAAFSVVLYHYSFRGYAADGLSALPYLALAPVTKYGFMGVDLFFLISGFVIMMTASGG